MTQRSRVRALLAPPSAHPASGQRWQTPVVSRCRAGAAQRAPYRRVPPMVAKGRELGTNRKLFERREELVGWIGSRTDLPRSPLDRGAVLYEAARGRFRHPRDLPQLRRGAPDGVCTGAVHAQDAAARPIPPAKRAARTPINRLAEHDRPRRSPPARPSTRPLYRRACCDDRVPRSRPTERAG